MGAEARRSLYEYCRLNQKQYLLDEWDDGRNLPLTPQTITYGSKRAAWWRCANGHTWRAVLYTRTGGRALSLLHGAKGAARLQRSGVGPPGAGAAVGTTRKTRRSSRRISAPEAGDPSGGGAKRGTAGGRSSGPARRAAAARSVPEDSSCPAKTTSRRSVRSLQSSGTLRETGISARRDVLPGTEKKVWWICERGHHWRAAISMRTRSLSSCPVCAGEAGPAGLQ